MYIAFVIWTIVALIFVIVAISSWKSETEAGFFTGVKPRKMKDVKAYNHAVGKLWLVFAFLFEVAGVPLLFIKQNSPIALISGGAVILLVIAISIAYICIENKYEEAER